MGLAISLRSKRGEQGLRVLLFSIWIAPSRRRSFIRAGTRAWGDIYKAWVRLTVWKIRGWVSVPYCAGTSGQKGKRWGVEEECYIRSSVLRHGRVSTVGELEEELYRYNGHPHVQRECLRCNSCTFFVPIVRPSVGRGDGAWVRLTVSKIRG